MDFKIRWLLLSALAALIGDTVQDCEIVACSNECKDKKGTDVPDFSILGGHTLPTVGPVGVVTNPTTGNDANVATEAVTEAVSELAVTTAKGAMLIQNKNGIFYGYCEKGKCHCNTKELYCAKLGIVGKCVEKSCGEYCETIFTNHKNDTRSKGHKCLEEVCCCGAFKIKNFGSVILLCITILCAHHAWFTINK